jgi:hypothetical protein
MTARARIGVAAAAAAAFALLAAGNAAAIEPPGFEELDDPAGALLGDPEDYDVGNGGWNGLSTFVQLAAGDGFDVKAVTGIDWDDLESGDILVILYPLNELDATHVNAFVRNGGRLILADDFGNSRKTFSRLKLAREEGVGVGAAEYYDDLPFAPIATPRMDHPLTRGISKLVTNHPAVIVDSGGADEIFGFTEGEAVVVAGQFGGGRFVVMSDPSILINSMLHHPGNFQFALNVLRYFSPDKRGRVVVLAGEFSLRGEPTNVLDDGTARSKVAARLRDVNSWLDEINDWLLDAGAIRILAVIGGLLLALLASVALPLKKGTLLDGAWLRARPRELDPGWRDGGNFHGVMQRFDDTGYRGSYLLPAAILRDTVDDTLADLLGVDQPLTSLRAADLLARVHQVCGPGPRDALTSSLTALQKLPTRAQAATEWSGQWVAKREFERVQREVERFYGALDAAGKTA